ncbi:hypothetical protein IGI57_002520 [Enterococcus sp. DIV0213j]|jgi:hypothetical protein|uniref:hypothetical protein n=1 Tax=Enterococcus sp. DIV0213j TaxID=2774649 RepID=UPI003D267529
MNKKIETMLVELQKECEKEGVTAICAIAKEGNTTHMAVGKSIADLAHCLAVQDESLDEELPMPTNVLRSIGITSLKEVSSDTPNSHKHTFVVYDLNDLPNIFERILRGDFK